MQHLARGRSTRGELVLSRAGDGHLELRVNGVFAMDTRTTSTEEALAHLTLAALSPGGAEPGPQALTVLVAGLGLGFTAGAVLGYSSVERLVIAEIEPDLVAWHRGLVPGGPALLSDPRVAVSVGDICAVVRRLPPVSVDAVILDVDNGPQNLLYDANAAVYADDFLADSRRVLKPGGVLAVWSADPSDALRATLSRQIGPVHHDRLPVRLGDRTEHYSIYLAHRSATVAVPGATPPSYGCGMSDTPEYRVEHDTMGEVRVPAEALWRAQTQRAVENFPISGQRLEPAHVRALGLVKAAAARVNGDLGVLDAEVAAAIEKAALEVAEGDHDAEFPIDVFQTGSGTSSNMNANEVIATLASRALGRDVHPNDGVNASQSSNDVFPTSIHVAATQAVVEDLLPALTHLARALSDKAAEFSDVVKSGRTHLMDATPVTLGQEFSGYADQVELGIERLEATLPRLAALPLGGTAVGTGINTPPGFAARVIAVLAEMTRLPLVEATNHFEAQGSRDSLVEASGQLRTIAVGLYKICTDLRWMGSGPRAGLGEIRLPDLQPGSSIMPGKVNPVIPEAVSMVCAQVVGNDAAVAFSGAVGNFELNVMMPVMAANLLQSVRLLANASRLLADRCVVGIEADREHCRTLAESSPSIVTPLNRYIGYENAAAVAKKALRECKTIREVVVEEGYVESGALTEEQLDAVLDVLSMTHP